MKTTIVKIIALLLLLSIFNTSCGVFKKSSKTGCPCDNLK